MLVKVDPVFFADHAYMKLLTDLSKTGMNIVYVVLMFRIWTLYVFVTVWGPISLISRFNPHFATWICHFCCWMLSEKLYKIIWHTAFFVVTGLMFHKSIKWFLNLKLKVHLWQNDRHDYHCLIFTRDPLHGLTLFPAWISNPMPSKVCGEITYQFPNFNGFAITYLIMDVIIYPCWD